MSEINTPFVFDNNSGFSVEEQQEILDKINSLNVEKGIVPQANLLNKQIKKQAKKRGVLLPVLVNIVALLLVAGGFFLLWSFHNRDEQEIRRGAAVLSITEQMLIQEIREETSRQLNEKEIEINDIRSRLANAGAEYQEDYLNAISRLRDEQVQISENARLREMGIWIQAEDRARALSSQTQQNQNVDAAGEELVRLTGEQNITAAIEAQLGGYYVMADRQIRAGEFDEADNTLMIMREFLNTPLFQNHSSETGRQMHLTAVSAMEDMLGEIYRLNTGDASRTRPSTTAQDEALADRLAELLDQYAALEQKAADQEREIAVYSSTGSEQSNIIRGYESDIRRLTTDNDSKDRDITRLTGNVESLNTQLRNETARANTAEADRDRQRNENTVLTQKVDSLPQVVENALEIQEIQDLLALPARQRLAQIVQQAIQNAMRQ